ncbi:Homeodomain-interacting protein kinase 2, partial [Araneus ventricosus]
MKLTLLYERSKSVIRE